MIAYLRKHGGASAEVSHEEAIWQKKYQELARVAAEREASLAARTADLERELRPRSVSGRRIQHFWRRTAVWSRKTRSSS